MDGQGGDRGGSGAGPVVFDMYIVFDLYVVSIEYIGAPHASAGPVSRSGSAVTKWIGRGPRGGSGPRGSQAIGIETAAVFGFPILANRISHLVQAAITGV